MVKGMLKLAGLVLFLVVVTTGAALFYLDRLAAVAIERGGSHALGVNTRVDGVSLRPFAGHISLSGFTVDNPAGFERPNFLIVDEASLDVAVGTLREDIVRARRFAVRGIKLDLEKNSRGSNYDAILNNLERYESGAADPAQESGDAGKRFVIEEVDIRDIEADVSMVAFGGEPQRLHVEVPAVTLRDVGSDGAVDMSELTNVIVKSVLQAVLSSDSLPRQLAADLRDSLDDLAALPGGLDAQTTGELRKAAEKVNESVGKVFDGLFGGKD